MIKLGRAIVKSRFVILALSLLLLIPSALGYLHTKVNYDILTYLPQDLETMQGQDILEEQFGTGAFAMYIVEGMDTADLVSLKSRIQEIDHVHDVIWYDSFVDPSFPREMLPEHLYEMFNKDDATLMAIIFDETTSEEGTLRAVRQIREISDQQCFLSGMSAVILDTKDLTEKETPIYVGIAVLLSALVLSLTMDSYLIPLFFLLSIGMAIIYNLGSNLLLGQISYITKAIAAVLQLGVTMDYSIFLWHSYCEQCAFCPEDHNEAMAKAVAATFTSVLGSSITTIAGFIALCFMSFTLGMDLGIVMAKGVLIGVVCCVTVLPSMILIFDRAIEKTRHKPLIPDLSRVSGFVIRHYRIFLIAFLAILVPAVYGYTHTDVYYKLDTSLPQDLNSMTAASKLNEKFDMSTTYMILVDSDVPGKDVREMTEQIENTDGIRFVLGLDSLIGSSIPDEFVPASIREIMESDNYKMLLIGSEYEVATDEVNAQCEAVSGIVKSYDPEGMVVGEAPCTLDLIRITDHDFNVVSWVSIGVIFLIILLIFGSVSLPVILVAVIEFAIFINMGIPFYTKTVLPFVASIVIGTIQLGSTVDYAILMTTRYRKERSGGTSRTDAVRKAHEMSIQSVFVSALSFFAATFGVGLYSDIDMIGSLCTLMARGALISMAVVICVLPAMYMMFDPIIIRTSRGFEGLKKNRERNTEEKGAVS